MASNLTTQLSDIIYTDTTYKMKKTTAFTGFSLQTL